MQQRRLFLGLSLLALATVAAALAWLTPGRVAGVATPPGNDSFASATVVGSLPFSDGPLSTTKATTETNEPAPSCGFNTVASVWYDFTPGANTTVRAETLSSDYDTVIAVYTGSTLATLQEVACNDQFNGDQSLLKFSATSGTTYHVQVTGWNGSTGNLTFKMKISSPPANDDFASATVVEALPFSDGPVETINATTEAGEPVSLQCSDTSVFIGNTVWYSFTPGVNTVVTADTAGSDYTTVLAVYTGATLGSLTNIECRTSYQVQTTIKFTAQAGVTYHFQAGAAFGGGNLTFNMAAAPAPGAHDVANSRFTGPSELPGKTAGAYTARVRNNGSVSEDVRVGFLVGGPAPASVTMAAGTLPPGAVVELGPLDLSGTLVMVIKVPLAAGGEADVPISVTLPNGYGAALVGEETCHQGDLAIGGRGFSTLGAGCLGVTDGSTDANPANDPPRVISVTEIPPYTPTVTPSPTHTPTPTTTPTSTPTPKPTATPKAPPTPNATAVASGNGSLRVDADCDDATNEAFAYGLLGKGPMTVCVFAQFPSPGSAAGYQVDAHWDSAVLTLDPRTAGQNDLWHLVPAASGGPPNGAGVSQTPGAGSIRVSAFDTQDENASPVFQGKVAEFVFSCKSHAATNIELQGPGVDTFFRNDGIGPVKPSLRAGVIQCLNPTFDSDRDGCTNQKELGTNQALGGRRDPLYVWDVMDQWTGLPFARDRIVAIGDIGAVVNRFGSAGDPSGNPLAPPFVATGYHTSADRNGSMPGQNSWNLRPPDGIIAVGDIGAVVAQFGHTCM